MSNVVQHAMLPVRKNIYRQVKIKFKQKLFVGYFEFDLNRENVTKIYLRIYIIFLMFTCKVIAKNKCHFHIIYVGSGYRL